MGKHSIEGVKNIIQHCTGLFFVKAQAEARDGNEEVRGKILDAMKEFDIGHSILHQAGITAKDLGVNPKTGRPRGPKRNV
jgi:hypothetical protein